jgi:hypothetical protein
MAALGPLWRGDLQLVVETTEIRKTEHDGSCDSAHNLFDRELQKPPKKHVFLLKKGIEDHLTKQGVDLVHVAQAYFNEDGPTWWDCGYKPEGSWDSPCCGTQIRLLSARIEIRPSVLLGVDDDSDSSEEDDGEPAPTEAPIDHRVTELMEQMKEEMKQMKEEMEQMKKAMGELRAENASLKSNQAQEQPGTSSH